MTNPNTPFLQQAAESLYRRYGEHISDLTLVFPSRRARLYFSEYLSRLITKPLWQPKTGSIDDIFGRITGLTAASSYLLITELYSAYTRNKATDETFDRFYFWGEVMLSDFEALDKYLVQVDPLLKNLAALKGVNSGLDFLSEEQQAAIRAFWKTFDVKGTSKIRENFVSLWDALLPTYYDYRKTLREKGCGYQGMIHREGAEMLKKNGYDFGLEKFVFIGFNALTECEKTLFRYLKKSGNAEFFWDYDRYYLADKHQEAGLFMRENLHEFPPAEFDAEYSPFTGKKDIQIIAAPSDVLQTKLLPTLLAEVCPEQTYDRRTAVVLADEGLLIPTLYSLPQNTETLNVTMGYPITHTPIYSLVELIIRLQKNARVTENQPVRFYHKDVLAVLQHQYVRAIAEVESRELCKKITEHNRVYVSTEEFKATDGSESQLFIEQIFTTHATPEAFIVMLQNLMKAVATAEGGNDSADSALRREYVVQAYKAINQLSDALRESDMELGMQVFMSLLRSSLQSLRIPFEGEPISGLQLMGVLETRTLDFENLVVLSLGEDIFPRGLSAPSLIPYNLRQGFGLPTVEQHEAMYAYYFYRLMQRAQRVRLVYNSQATDSSTGEMSRYLRQLMLESPHDVATRSITYSVTYTKPKPIVVEKSGEVADMLSEYFDGGKRSLSASSFNKYLACPLQFYFEKIAHLHEPEEVTEEVDGRMLGNIFHQTIHELYEPLLNKNTTEEDIKALLTDKAKITSVVEKFTAQEFFGNEKEVDEVHRNGKLLMVKEAVVKYIIATLKYDTQHAPFTIAGLEQPIDGKISVAVNGSPRDVKFVGTIDRMDTRARHTCIIDYKTGSADERKTRFASVEALFSESVNQRRPEVLQTLLYSLLVQKNHKAAAVQPALYFVRNMFKNDFNSQIKIKSTKSYDAVDDATQYLPRFEELLQGKLGELFDLKRPFVQTDEVDTCLYCPYKEICHK